MLNALVSSEAIHFKQTSQTVCTVEQFRHTLNVLLHYLVNYMVPFFLHRVRKKMEPIMF